MLNPSWGRRGGGAVDGRGGWRMHIVYVNGIRGGGIMEPVAAVTVQFLSKGHCTARVARLGLTGN